jgi:hypothetical protein
MFDRIRLAMHNKRRLKWEKKRKHGRRPYIMYRGVLQWGGIMFVLYICSDVFVRHQRLTWSFALSMLVACFLAGYAWGFCTWIVNEKRFGYKAI